MTVAELIAELDKYPPDMLVVMHPYNRLSPVIETKTQTLRKGTEDEYTFVELNAGVLRDV